MYEIKNGILHKDGKKLFVLGESYYPSFHPSKFPVMPDGDRMGEMVKDLRMMAEAGFNHVRFAALGNVTYDADSETASIEAPFVDAMVKEADKNDLSVSIRLQGFSVNFRGFTDGDIMDENGHTPNFAWSDFVRSTLTHKGILEDNFVYGRDVAKHFGQFDNVVGFQIYNEPKFPQHNTVTCDYNPHAIDAFRKWLVEKGVLGENEAKNYLPPRGRHDQSARMWALWRMFSMETLTAFLDNASRGAKAGAERPTFTCLTADTGCKTNPKRGVDPFGDAKTMDMVGYTIYRHAWGADYYSMCLEGDTFQCAAESEGKQAWCIELDSRTYIPCSVYNKGAYATIGSGVKGIVYYQWRGDCPVPGVPFPNSCGILNYDGTKTDNFDNAVTVNRFISGLNDLLVGAHRAREGIALLYSPYAVAMADGLQNSDYLPGNTRYYNTYVMAYHQLYQQLRNTGYTVTVTDANHLTDNLLGVKVLIVPDFTLLSPQEQAAVERFAQQGQVYVNIEGGAPLRAFCGLKAYTKESKSYRERVYDPFFSTNDLPLLTGITPIARSLEPNVGVQVLQGADHTLLVLTNISPIQERADAILRVSIPFATAEFVAIDGSRPVELRGDTLTVKDMTDGGIVILR